MRRQSSFNPHEKEILTCRPKTGRTLLYIDSVPTEFSWLPGQPCISNIYSMELNDSTFLKAFCSRLQKDYLWQLEAWAAFTIDNATGRQVWYNFWDTKLTFENSYLARLNYVHQNPVKHGLVCIAN